MVVNDCSAWFADVNARLPTVVLAARDAKGHDLLIVHVSLDGAPIAERLGGTAIAVDPGPHVFRFEASGSTATDERIIIHEGEKARLVSSVLRPLDAESSLTPSPKPSAQPSAESPTPRLLPTLVLGSVGGVALGSFVAFGTLGQSQKNHLAETCGATRSCSRDDVAVARTNLIVADVSLGVGVVALAIGTYTLVRALDVPRQRQVVSNVEGRMQWRAEPTRGGAMVTIVHVF
ncbi:MAG: hypothetical protein NVSMB1_13600 [Polyangiales bacterium]